MPSQSLIENKLPVFTTPQQQITFYADDPSTHKQILTIYNPYDFDVTFRVYCTDCSKYMVSASQGALKSNHSVDIVIQHRSVSAANIGVSDTIRIQLICSGVLKASGKKDMPIMLLPRRPQENALLGHAENTDRFKPLMTESTTPRNLRQDPLLGHAERGKSKCQTLIYVIALVIGIIALLLPSEGDVSALPTHLHLTQHIKLVAAYVLGMATIALFLT